MVAVPMNPFPVSFPLVRRTADGARSYAERFLIFIAVLLAWGAMMPARPASALLPLSMISDASVPVGANAKSFTVADCDGDGSLDLVAAGQESNDVIQHLNNGDGTFRFDERL